MGSAPPPRPSPAPDPPDFALFVGGPLHRLWQRLRLTGDTLQWPHRRTIVLALIAWAPLLILSIVEGHAWGTGVELPFLRDVELHVRLLVALPLLLAAEWQLHGRLVPIARHFVMRGLVPDGARARLDAAVVSAMRMRDSAWAEGLLLAFAYVVGVGVVWRTQVASGVTSWHGGATEGRHLAGWWLMLVSLPIFQLLLLRWYYRLFIWARFLWQVSRIELSFMPTHPDRCGGMGFLSTATGGFAALLMAQGATLAGLMASRIFHAGAKLPEFRLELIGLVTVMVSAVLGPLLVFVPQLVRARRVGDREYGSLAQRYAREFEGKWLRGTPPDESLLGSADIQSLADMSNSYAVVKEMRIVPFTVKDMFNLGIATLLPIAPLLLTLMPLEDLLVRLLHIVF